MHNRIPMLNCQAREPESILPHQLVALILALVDLTAAAGKHHYKVTPTH
jgi:hypothetical protein